MADLTELSAAIKSDAREAVLRLLRSRDPDATVCPSEAARALARDAGRSAAGWRDLMPLVHDAVDGLLAEGIVSLSWKGRVLLSREGPYRVGRSRAFE